jgi:hypothetical protein
MVEPLDPLLDISSEAERGHFETVHRTDPISFSFEPQFQSLDLPSAPFVDDAE